MAYNTYFSQPNYPSQFNTTPMPNQNFSYGNQVNQPTNDIKWVQGESAARAYPISAGSSILLMDSEDDVFYVKTSDASGMPMPLRVFEYKERTPEPQSAAQQDLTGYVTKDEFEKRIDELKKIMIFKEEEKNK